MTQHVRMFNPQFAPLVESGSKCQTVRPMPKRMPNPGDRISLREWTGKPYRSKQRILLESTITHVLRVRLEDTGREVLMSIGDRLLTPEKIGEFANAYGFKGACDFVNWFERVHGLPFEGIVIKWENHG